MPAKRTKKSHGSFAAWPLAAVSLFQEKNFLLGARKFLVIFG
jgi:hypothetical protein